MKKFFSLLILSLAVLGLSPAWALPDFITPTVKTSDAQIKATSGVVYGVNVAYSGVTIGDKIEVKNSTDNSGTAIYTCIAATANGVCQYNPPVGDYYGTAIYYDETKSGGTFTTSIKYF